MPIVTAHIKFSMSTTFLDNFFTAEDERLPGESIEDGVLRVRKHLENAVERLKKEHESMRGVQETYPQPFPDPKRHGHMTSGQLPPQQVTYGPTPEINRQHERIQIAIENAKTLDELKATKIAGLAVPASLVNLYNQKLELLTK